MNDHLFASLVVIFSGVAGWAAALVRVAIHEAKHHAAPPCEMCGAPADCAACELTMHEVGEGQVGIEQRRVELCETCYRESRALDAMPDLDEMDQADQ